ncbi:interleukin-5 receptor subunit alpha-like isoform X2 [Ascaphus truei]
MWDCNITEEMQKYEYYIKIHHNLNQLKLEKCFSEIKTNYLRRELHNGVSVDIVTKRSKTVNNTWKKKTFFHEGQNGTSVENLSCVAYNVSYMNCSWDVGKKAPEDTQYSLSLIQEDNTETCQDYRMDSLGRQIECFFKCLKISFLDRIYILVTGSSNVTHIRFTDKWLTPAEHEILNSPRNIQIYSSLHDLIITWEKPNTSHPYPSYCYKYEINLKSKGNEQNYTTEKLENYTITEFNLNRKYTLRVRAMRFESCHSNLNWSAWSEPLVFGNSASFTEIHYFILATIGMVIFIAVLIFLCHRYSVLNILFHPIPQPQKDFSNIAHQFQENKVKNECVEYNQLLLITESEEHNITLVEEIL